jgi:hypothetical protein
MKKHWVIDKIENLEIKNKDTDMVVLSFDPNKTTLDGAFEVYKDISNAFPNHNIIAKLIDCKMEIKDIDYLIEELQTLKEKKQNEDIH